CKPNLYSSNDEFWNGSSNSTAYPSANAYSISGAHANSPVSEDRVINVLTSSSPLGEPSGLTRSNTSGSGMPSSSLLRTASFGSALTSPARPDQESTANSIMR